MEGFAAITFGIMIFCGVLVLLSPLGKKQDRIKNRMETVANLDKKEFVLDDELSKPLSERFLKPLLDNIVQTLRRLLPEDRGRGKGSKQEEHLSKKLRQAGFRLDTNEYRAVQILVLAAFAVLAGLIAFLITFDVVMSLISGLFGVYLGYTVLRFYVARRVSTRSEIMRRQLPDVLDMLSVSVEAGLGLEQAMLQVINHFQGPLVDELSIAYREMSMGRNRRDALQRLGERSGIEEVNSFTRAVIQAGQMGIPVKNVLRAQSEFIRQTRRNKIEEKAMQVSVKILLPMAFFIFPVLFIVLLGPAVVSIMDQLL